MSTPEKPQGPKAPRPQGTTWYFLSIENKYGHPIAHRLDVLKACQGMKPMEQVNWLKAEHGMGHGHANALVAYALAAKPGA